MDDDLHGLAGNAHFKRARPIFSEQELLEDEAGTLLFSHSQLTSLGAMLFLLNVFHIYRTSNLFISNLFTFYHTSHEDLTKK